MIEKNIILYETDHEIIFDFEVTASHIRYGRFYIKETILDDWEITLISVDGLPIKMFTPEAKQEIIKALEDHTDLIDEQRDAHVNDALYEEIDRRCDVIKDKVVIA